MDQSILFISIIEENNNRCILDVTKELFLLSDYEVVYENINGDIIGFFDGYRILIVFDFLSRDLVNMNFNDFHFDIIVHSFINNYDNPNINNLFKMSKVCIFNADDDNLISLLSKLENVIAITYGFNNKSTLTVSSFNMNPMITANLCLQRDIIPFCGEKIEPFEFYLELSSENEECLYTLLAAATLNLVIGDSILSRKPYKSIKINY